MKDVYGSDFEKFLAHTDEKQILLEEISKEIEKYDVKSLLDIGAGNGVLSIPLSKRVENYLAVESNKNFVAKLRKAGLAVREGNFPLVISRSFDMVLASHAVSYLKDLFEPFIYEAWKSVNPGGVFLVITYRGQEDDWTRLMRELGENRENPNRVGFNSIIELLASLGEVKMRKAITKVRTENIEYMLFALSFVASDGEAEKKEAFLQKQAQLCKILDSRYKDAEGFFFPFQHFFIIAKKT